LPTTINVYSADKRGVAYETLLPVRAATVVSIGSESDGRCAAVVSPIAGQEPLHLPVRLGNAHRSVNVRTRAPTAGDSTARARSGVTNELRGNASRLKPPQFFEQRCISTFGLQRRSQRLVCQPDAAFGSLLRTFKNVGHFAVGQSLTVSK